jgi:cell division protein FtsL
MAAVDWFAGEVAAPPVRQARPRTRTRTRTRTAPRTRARSQRRVRGGIAWIAAFAVVLTGVVALNVVVLQANMRVSRLDKAQIELQAQNAALASQVSSAASAQRIEQAAHRLGYVPAPATDTSYLELAQK